MTKIITLFVAGGAGTLLRFLFSTKITHSFMTGTLVVNILGCTLMGFLLGIKPERFPLGLDLRFLLMVGFCGAFTTFSTFTLETALFLREGNFLKAFLYVMLHVSVGLAIFYAGLLIGEQL